MTGAAPRSGLTVRTRPFDPAEDLLAHLPGPGGLAWLRRGEGFVGVGEAARIEVGTGPDRVARVARALADLAGSAATEDPVGLPGGGLRAVVSLTFDPRDPGSVAVVPKAVVGRREGRGFLTTVGGAGPPPPPSPAVPTGDRARYAGSSLPDLHWLAAVATAVDRIGRGELQKVVLARDHAVWSQAPFDARVLAGRLARRFPDCTTFLCGALVGATPELLVRRRAREVESVVLAGSARRGATPQEDARIGAGLLNSAKDREEHRLAVESVAAVLTGRCRDLEVDDKPALLRLDNVQHLATRVRGRLAGRSRVPALAGPSGAPTALELAGALHPTAAVGGVPTDRALAAIDEMEGMNRGRYAGPVGWVAADGDGEFGIALRCAQLSGARARLFAGAGIVSGSLPEAELEETRLKLLAMQSAFDPSRD